MGKTNTIPTFSSLVGKQVGVGDRLSTYLSLPPRMIFISMYCIWMIAVATIWGHTAMC